LRKLLKKRFLGIPMAVIAVILVTAVALATILIGPVTQTITQTITEPPVVYDYGTIEQPGNILLNNVVAGESGTETFPGAVIVHLGPDGVGKYLHITLSGDLGSYDGWYDVTLKSEGCPMGTVEFHAGLSALDASYQLTLEGTYIFSQKVQYDAGDTPGPAIVSANFSLQDTE